MGSLPANKGALSTPMGLKKADSQFPAHPISQLQGPFDESILEANEGTGNEWVVEIDTQCRRRNLLERAEYERLCGRKWRQRPGERYHPLWKLISMISFGIHLLAKGIAKSEMEVLRILQTYVDELDGFIERSKEDFLIIQIDVRIRIQYLSLPLGNLDVFDEMLEERNFRHAMIDYNEKIEHAVERFSTAVRDAQHDVHKGQEATSALWHYIGWVSQSGDRPPGNLDAVCNAMLANIEGWNKAFRKLHKRGTDLDAALFELGMAAVEMQRRVSSANPPRKRSQVKSVADRFLENNRLSTISSFQASDKPLPSDPVPVDAVRKRPAAEQSKVWRVTTKSVPNLRTVEESQHAEEAKAFTNNQSSINTGENVELDGSVPTAQRNFGRRLSKPAQNGLVCSRPEGARARPATAPSRILKGRSVSLEHLKSLCSGKKMQQQATMSKPPDFSAKQTINPSRLDTLKRQILHYLNSDNVTEAWEAMVRNEESSRRCPQKKISWPLSIFRARASGNCRTSCEPDADPLKHGLGGRMAWLEEEPETLNTYSLKPKLDISPRIHAFSTQQALTEGVEGVHDSGDQNMGTETGSIITALPAIPHPPIDEFNRLAFIRDSGSAQATEGLHQRPSPSS